MAGIRKGMIILFALGMVLTLSSPHLVSASGDTDLSRIDSAIEAQMRKHGLPGVALAVIEGDRIVYLKGYGTAGGGRPMTPQTGMFIGSQSKSFTALAIAQLADQGVLDLNSPVRTYIPWFQVQDQEASGVITLNHLLHHTSGLSEAGYPVILPNNASPEQAVRSLAEAKMTAPVGAKFQYFNLGYAVLAYVVEVTSGEAYADYLKGHIFDPLGMDATTARPRSAENLAWGYSRLFGFAVPMSQPVRDFEIGAGYIVSTAEDMARYAVAMKNGGEGLVSAQMSRKIFTPGLASYGMGWFIGSGGEKIFHGGANETFRTDVNLYPKTDRAFVLLSNQGYQIDHFVSAVQLEQTVEAAVLGMAELPAAQGWSVRWIGAGLGILVLGLTVLHLRNFYTLFKDWKVRAAGMKSLKLSLDIAINFLIPTLILVVIFSQVRAFYGYRFNLLTTLVNFRLVLPDVFILMLVSILADYIQGLIKLFWTVRKKLRTAREEIAGMKHVGQA
jgi:CubicO group peptidase (beta-lactamase class C family)